MDGEVDGGGSQTQKEQIQELLTALGITRVVNVDDDHAQGTQQSKEDVLGAIRALSIDMVLVARLILPDSEDEQAGELSQDEVLDLVSTNQRGEVVVDEMGDTGVRGVFAAGDVTATKDKQIVIAAGEGAKAALAAFDYLITQR